MRCPMLPIILLPAVLAFLHPVQLAAAEPYLTAGAIDVAALLPPPAALGSAEELAELALVLTLQDQRGAGDALRIRSEDAMSLATFSDAVGPWFSPSGCPRSPPWSWPSMPNAGPSSTPARRSTPTPGRRPWTPA